MIHRIRIQNFKSLRDVTVDFSPVTVLIGKSGTGKTNFASAIRFLRDCLASAPQPPQGYQYALLKCATNPAGAIGFEVEFDVPGFTDRFVYSITFDDQNIAHPPRTEYLARGAHPVFRQARAGGLLEGARWEKEPSLISPPQPGLLALGRLPGLEEAADAYTVLTALIGVYAFPYDVLKTPSRPAGVAGLADDAGNFMEVLREITRSLQDITTRKAIPAALRRINATVASVQLDSVQSPTKVIVGHRLGEKILPLELAQESNGFRRFYAHLLALYQKPPKQTLVFEEPENGIYLGALAVLAEEFQAASDAGRGQVILTTHSPALLDHFSAGQIRVVELVDLETRIGPLAEEQKEALAEELLHAGELLTVDPARGQAVS